MVNLFDLRDELTHAIKSAQDIMKRVETDGRSLTEDEQKEFDGIQEEVVRLEKAITRGEETNKRREISIKNVETLKEGNGRKTDPMPPDSTRNVEGDGEERALISQHAAPLSSLKAFKGPDAQKDAGAVGKWLRATFYGDLRAKQWCKTYGERLRGADLRAQEIGVNTAGGFLVPAPLETAIINLREMYGVFRRECRAIPMADSTLTIPRKTSGLTANFTAESIAATESDLVFDNVGLVAKKLAVITRISSEMSEDAVVDIADMVAEAMAEAFALKEDQCGFSGTGAQTFAGIVGLETAVLDVNNTACKVAVSGIDTMAEISTTHLTQVMGKLPIFARLGAKWFCSNTFADVVFGRLAAAAGGNTIQTIAGAFAQAFLGFPIVLSTLLEQSTGTVNGTPYCFFGDLRKAATMGDRRTITVTTAEQRYFVEDQIAIKATERFDINIHDLGDNTTAGPITTLIGTT